MVAVAGSDAAPLPTNALAERLDLSYNYLLTIVAELRRAGFVKMLNTTSVIVPLVDRCHRSGWLPIRVWTNSSADLDSTRRRRLLLSHSALDPRAYRAAHLHRGALPHRIDGRTVPAEQQAPGVRSASRRPILVPHSPTLIGPSDSNSDLFGANQARCAEGVNG